MNLSLRTIGQSRVRRLALGLLLSGGLAAGAASSAVPADAAFIPPPNVTPSPVISAYCGYLVALPLNVVAVEGKFFTPGGPVTIQLADFSGTEVGAVPIMAGTDGTIHVGLEVLDLVDPVTITASPGFGPVPDGPVSNAVTVSC